MYEDCYNLELVLKSSCITNQVRLLVNELRDFNTLFLSYLFLRLILQITLVQLVYLAITSKLTKRI